MYVVIHDDEDVIPENGLVTLVHHTYACADVCFKIIIGSGERGGFSLVLSPGLTTVATSASPLVSLELAVLLASWIVLLLVEIQQ